MPTAPRPTARRLVCAGGLWLAAAGVADAQPPILPAPKPAPTVVAPVVVPPAVCTRYALGEAIAIARERHPLLEAMRLSMNAALTKNRGVGEAKRMAGFITPDIDYRLQQSDLGIRAAMAEYAQAEHEVTFAVIRCYYTVVYARAQTAVARDLVENLETYLEQVHRSVNVKGQGLPGASRNTEDQLRVAVAESRLRLNQAEVGTDRARAALREAMGLDPGARVDVIDAALPDVSDAVAKLDRDTVIAHAITRRGEIILSNIGADVTRIEACAQWAKRFNLTADTFARGADIHARSIPAAEREPQYRPGAIPPEMPTQLVGRRETRKTTAEIYASRAEAAAVQTRSLVALEAENTYYRFVEVARNVKATRPGAKAARDMTERRRAAAGAMDKGTEFFLSEVSSSRALASFNEALYDQLVALANLERATAGGVSVNFPGR